MSRQLPLTAAAAVATSPVVASPGQEGRLETVAEYENRTREALANSRKSADMETRARWLRIADEWSRLAEARAREFNHSEIKTR